MRTSTLTISRAGSYIAVLTIGIVLGWLGSRTSSLVHPAPDPSGSNASVARGPASPPPAAESDPNPLIDRLQSRVNELEAEISERATELAEAEAAAAWHPRRILEAFLAEPGEVLYTNELLARAAQSQNPLIEALAMEVKLDYYSAEDALKVALLSVAGTSVTQAGVVAARFLGDQLTPELRATLDLEFASGSCAGGNWVVAVAFDTAGDSTYLADWANKAAAEILASSDSTPAILRCLEGCRLYPTIESEVVAIQASRHVSDAIRWKSVAALEATGTTSVPARRELARLCEDSNERIRADASVALSRVEARLAE